MISTSVHALAVDDDVDGAGRYVLEVWRRVFEAQPIVVDLHAGRSAHRSYVLHNKQQPTVPSMDWASHTKTRVLSAHW